MTTEQRKEQLRKQFFEFTTLVSGVTIHSEASANQIFNFFYSEIEARETHEMLRREEVKVLMREVQRLEEIIKASDKIIGESAPIWRSDSDRWEEYYKLIDAYNKLKSKT